MQSLSLHKDRQGVNMLQKLWDEARGEVVGGAILYVLASAFAMFKAAPDWRIKVLLIAAGGALMITGEQTGFVISAQPIIP
jgi:hypothetical protein